MFWRVERLFSQLHSRQCFSTQYIWLWCLALGFLVDGFKVTENGSIKTWINIKVIESQRNSSALDICLQRSYVFSAFCLFVLFCQWDYTKSTKLTLMKLSEEVRNDQRKNVFNPDELIENAHVKKDFNEKLSILQKNKCQPENQISKIYYEMWMICR